MLRAKPLKKSSNIIKFYNNALFSLITMNRDEKCNEIIIILIYFRKVVCLLKRMPDKRAFMQYFVVSVIIERSKMRFSYMINSI